MTFSLPSPKIISVEIPEVENFVGTFVYNFFTPDERVNDNGEAPDSVLKRPSESFDSSYLSSIDRFTPRYIKFSWKSTFKGTHNAFAESVSIADNLTRIHNEEAFTSDNYTSVYFQDYDLDSKTSLYVNEASDNITKNQPIVEDKSLLDVAKTINESTSEEITGNFLANAINNLSKFKINFVNAKTNTTNTISNLDDLKGVKNIVQINNKFITPFVNSVRQDGAGLFLDEFSALSDLAASIQSTAVSNVNSNLISGEDYDIQILDYIGYRNLDTNGYVPVNQVIGYIIEKDEVLTDGTTISHDPIVLEGPNSTSTVDIKIKYGTTYVYRVRSVAYMEYQAEDNNSNSVIIVSFLASSHPTQIVVNTEEFVPPPWPSDFNIQWDYTQQCARLLWSFPPNTQRDVKKFQVFRRGSIYEPFQLIKMYDFDDSIVRSPYYEIPDISLVELMTDPKSYYMDTEFTKDSKCIYTLCSIDAHGFTSNYGPQIEVSFDKFTNKLKKKLISTGGAPKQYPNMYLKQETFVDTVKDSGHSKVDVYFNPDYLKLVNTNGNDMKLLTNDLLGGKYRLQMINVDLQEQEIVDINILDRRNSSLKP